MTAAEVAKLERLVGDMLHAQHKQEGKLVRLEAVNVSLLEALKTLRSVVKEGGVPRYTVTPGAALNSAIEEVVDPAIKRAEGRP